MQCPVCLQVQLVMADRQGVEIDYCPQCRGVWLDRGELDKIIERTSEYGQPQAAVSSHQVPAPQAGPYQQGYAPYPQKHSKKKKPKSLLRELFDFDFD